MCSVCFKIYAAAPKAVRRYPPPLHCIRYQRSNLLPWSPPPHRATSRHSNLRPILRHPSLLACAMRCDSATPDSSNLPLCTYAFTASLPRRLATACHLSPPTHGRPTSFTPNRVVVAHRTPLVAVSSLSCLPILVRVIESGLGSGLGSVVRVRVRVRARISPRDACAYATPVRHAR